MTPSLETFQLKSQPSRRLVHHLNEFFWPPSLTAKNSSEVEQRPTSRQLDNSKFPLSRSWVCTNSRLLNTPLSAANTVHVDWKTPKLARTIYKWTTTAVVRVKTTDFSTLVFSPTRLVRTISWTPLCSVRQELSFDTPFAAARAPDHSQLVTRWPSNKRCKFHEKATVIVVFFGSFAIQNTFKDLYKLSSSRSTFITYVDTRVLFCIQDLLVTVFYFI